jgi:hypothetical protein
MKRFWPGALLPVLLLGLAAAACGGDDTTPSDGSRPTATPAGAGTDGGSKSDGLSALRNVAQNSNQTTYRVVYDIEGMDPSSGEISGTLTLAAKPPKQLFSLSGEFAGEESTLTMIDDGESSFLCIETEGNQSCLRSPSGGGGSIPLPTILEVEELIETLADDKDATVREVRGQKIAGRDGKCFEIQSREGEGTVCIDEKDGILLLLDGTFDGARITLRAAEIAGAPSDSDFEPPFPVIGG